jgi:hypothetical protein
MSDKPRTCSTCKYFLGLRDGGTCANLKATQHYKTRVARDHTCDRHRNDPDKAPGKVPVFICERGL